MASAQKADFQIALDAAGVKGTAVDAAEALTKLQSQLAADKKAVNELQAAMKNLKSGSNPNLQQLEDLQKQLLNKKEAVAKAQSSIISLGGSLKRTRTDKFRDGLKGIASEAKNVGGPLGGLFGRIENLTKVAGSGAVKYVAFAGAIAVVSGAAAFAATQLYNLATASAEARREEDLTLQGQLSLAQGITDTAAASQELLSTIDQVSAGSAASRSVISGLGKDLYTAGLRGGALQDALDAAATTASVQGPQAAAKFVQLAAATDKAGGSVTDLAQKVQTQIGGIAQQQLLSTTVQAEKFKEAVGSMFAGIKLDGLLRVRKGWTDMFSSATASGKAFRAILEPIAEMLIAGVASFQEVLQRAVVRVLIWAVKIEIAWLKLKRAFFEVVPKDIFDGFFDKQVLIDGLVVALIAMGVALAPLAASALAAAAPFVLMGVAIWAAINTVRLLIDLWNELDLSSEGLARLWDTWTGEWKAMSTNLVGDIIDGIMMAISKGAPLVWKAMKGLGVGALTALKDVLGIHSPSVEFAKVGLAVPQGVSQGIDRGKPRVDRSLEELVDPRLVVPDVQMGRVAGQALAPGAGAGSSVAGDTASTVNNFTMNITGRDAREIAASVEESIRKMFALTAQTMGAV